MFTTEAVHRCSSKWPKRPATLLKRLQRRCFPVKFAKLLRTPFYRTPLRAASVAKTDQKKDFLRIFL